MSDVVHVTDSDTLDRMLEDWDYVVIDFSAPSWCVPCQRLAPHYKVAAEKMPNVVFIEIDIDEADQQIARNYGIMSVPTVQMYENGRYVKDLKARTSVALVAEIKAVTE